MNKSCGDDDSRTKIFGELVDLLRHSQPFEPSRDNGEESTNQTRNLEMRPRPIQSFENQFRFSDIVNSSDPKTCSQE